MEGYEMVSTDEKEEPFVLEKDECWVVADNENVKQKVYRIPPLAFQLFGSFYYF